MPLKSLIKAQQEGYHEALGSAVQQYKQVEQAILMVQNQVQLVNNAIQ
jgi:hypothetical protein